MKETNRASGFIALPRAFFRSAIWLKHREKTPTEAYLDLLQMARYGAATERVTINRVEVEIGRGEILATRESLADRWQWSVGQVRYFIRQLLKEGYIARSKDIAGVCLIYRIVDSQELAAASELPEPASGKACSRVDSRVGSRAGSARNSLIISDDEAKENPAFNRPPDRVLSPDKNKGEKKKEEENSLASFSKEASSPARGKEACSKEASSPARRGAVATRKAFTPPTEEEVAAYCCERGYVGVDAGRFVDYYTANGWYVGNRKMRDWQATVRNWARREESRSREATTPTPTEAYRLHDLAPAAATSAAPAAACLTGEFPPVAQNPEFPPIPSTPAEVEAEMKAVLPALMAPLQNLQPTNPEIYGQATSYGGRLGAGRQPHSNSNFNSNSNSGCNRYGRYDRYDPLHAKQRANEESLCDFAARAIWRQQQLAHKERDF